MSEIVVPRAVKREAGYLYYVDKDGNVCRAKMGRAKKKQNMVRKSEEEVEEEEEAEAKPSQKQDSVKYAEVEITLGLLNQKLNYIISKLEK